jgi:hypothetical protein
VFYGPPYRDKRVVGVFVRFAPLHWKHITQDFVSQFQHGTETLARRRINLPIPGIAMFGKHQFGMRSTRCQRIEEKGGVFQLTESGQ